MPDRWEHDIDHLTQAEIMFAVKCDVWQEFRLRMKGKSTVDKLVLLSSWLKDMVFSTYRCEHCTQEVRQHQVDNYLNALKRGGQLDLEGVVQR